METNGEMKLKAKERKMEEKRKSARTKESK
jgi:hypothetical protein